jgi:hypothetical protein
MVGSRATKAVAGAVAATSSEIADTSIDETRLAGGFVRYRYGDSNPGFRRERAAS